MELEVGLILEGKVKGITKFGAFVELPEGKTGMVHISEVAPNFVSDITEYVQENQTVKVKVIKIGDDGKVSLSMKQAMEKENRPAQNRQQRQPRTSKSTRPASYDWQGSRKASESLSFEDMMSKFKKTSDEKMSDLKRVTESKRGGFSRRGNGNQPR